MTGILLQGTLDAGIGGPSPPTDTAPFIGLNYPSSVFFTVSCSGTPAAGSIGPVFGTGQFSIGAPGGDPVIIKSSVGSTTVGSITSYYIKTELMGITGPLSVNGTLLTSSNTILTQTPSYTSSSSIFVACVNPDGSCYVTQSISPPVANMELFSESYNGTLAGYYDIRPALGIGEYPATSNLQYQLLLELNGFTFLFDTGSPGYANSLPNTPASRSSAAMSAVFAHQPAGVNVCTSATVEIDVGKFQYEALVSDSSNFQTLLIGGIQSVPVNTNIAFSGNDSSASLGTLVTMCEPGVGGARYESAASLSGSLTFLGTAYAINTNGSQLQPGMYGFQVFDGYIGTPSNIETFAVFPNNLILDAVTATLNVPVDLSGLDYETPVASFVTYSLDEGTLASVTSFVPATTTGGVWSGVGPTISTPGTYTISLISNEDLPSNTQTFVVSSSGTITPPAGNPMDVLFLLPKPKQQFFDNNGRPLAGGSVTVYVEGTTSFGTTWADPFGVKVNPNPLTLDSSGSCVLWGSGNYTLIAQDSNGVTWDNGPTTVPQISTALEAVFASATIAEAVTLLGIGLGNVVPCTATISGTALSCTRAANTNPLTQANGAFLCFTAPSTATGPFTLAVPGDNLSAASLQDATGNNISQLNAQQFCLVGWNAVTSAWILLFAPQTPATVFPFSYPGGTWTAGQGVDSILCTGAGGGGAGGGSNVNNCGAGGGGGAQAVENMLVSVTPGMTYQVSIGAGGTGGVGVAGGAGTATTLISSTFTTLVALAPGGGGAAGVPVSSSGGTSVAGGSSGGTGAAAGQPGYYFSAPNLSVGGAGGGNALYGQGAPTNFGAGVNAVSPGTGGSGAAPFGITGAVAGGNGANGTFMIQIP